MASFDQESMEREKIFPFTESKDYEAVEGLIGYRFKNRDLLLQAFTRSSFAREYDGWRDNERLEFVGDKVLDFIIVQKLVREYSGMFDGTRLSLRAIAYEGDLKEFPAQEWLYKAPLFDILRSEAEMTEIKKQLVQSFSLSAAIERLGLEQYLLMGKGDRKLQVQNQQSVKEDLFEAIIGAIAIDSGWDLKAVEHSIDIMLNPDEYIRGGVGDDDGMDYVALLEEWYREEYDGKLPDYEYSEPEHSLEGVNCIECWLSLPYYRNADFSGQDTTVERATRIVARRAYQYLQRLDEFRKKVLSTVGEITLKNARAKLNELWQNGFIEKPEFICTESDMSEPDKTMWSCVCKIGDTEYEETGSWLGSSKAEAKDLAAFETIHILLGKNWIQERWDDLWREGKVTVVKERTCTENT